MFGVCECVFEDVQFDLLLTSLKADSVSDLRPLDKEEACAGGSTGVPALQQGPMHLAAMATTTTTAPSVYT